MFKFEMSTATLRLVIKSIIGRVMSSDEVDAFLLVHGEQLHNAITSTVREFVVAKLQRSSSDVKRG